MEKHKTVSSAGDSRGATAALEAQPDRKDAGKSRGPRAGRNIMLVLAYEGTNYRGWQFQPGEPTIQGVLEEKISAMTGEKTTLIGSGRTDAGVHALAQTANYRTLSRIPEDGFLRGLNSLLPHDITVREVRVVPDDFHARYSAVSKVYSYLVRNDSLIDPFWRRFSWTIHKKLDIEAMNRAAKALLGQRDFSAFQASGSSTVHSVRTVTKAEWRGCGKNRFIFSIEADGFLRHMVRNIVGTLIDVGLGKADIGHLERVLAGKNRKEAGATAPARGLFLKEVRYIS